MCQALGSMIDMLQLSRWLQGTNNLGKDEQTIIIKCYNQQSVIDDMPWEAQGV